MGIDATDEEILELLEIYNGNIEQVLDVFFAGK